MPQGGMGIKPGASAPGHLGKKKLRPERAREKIYLPAFRHPSRCNVCGACTPGFIPVPLCCGIKKAP